MKNKKGYNWNKIGDKEVKLGYQGDISLGHTPAIWIEDLNNVEIEEPILDKMIPEFLEKYQKIVIPLIKMKHKKNRGN